ncbi:calphotin-like [Schistocerca serialis cubense]|uniref:calphotin-like n=1 Tax=Schistocerca serialis cubense TaxID=2023355 RepID=UPI00214E0C12|nr:calphotin-like [Schistocerca serialis cubense]
MRYLIIVAAALHVVLGGVSQVAVRLPFLNPAGVTYLNGPAPAGLAAGPVGYAAAGPAAVGYAAAGPAAVGYAAAAPAAVGYAAAAPAAVGYAAAPVAVPTVHHVPGVADVPVTRIEAQPGVVQQQIDVAHPAVATRKFEVRRPAIQKQFYDIEERVVIRPAGSALVELDEPTSRLQRGPTVVSPVGPGAAVAAGPVVAAPAAIAAAPAAVAAGPAYAPVVAATPAPVFVSSTPAPALGAYPGPGGPAPGAPAQFESDDSISVENPEFSARAAAAAQQQYESQQRAAAAQQQYEAQQRAAAQQQQYEAQQRAAAQQQQYEAQQRASAQQQQYEAQQRAAAQQQQYEAEQRAAAAAQHQAAGPLPSPQPEIRTNGAPLEQIARAQPLAGPDVVPSLRSIHPEENQANQQRLIQLLTARGGVTEVGFGRAGPAGAPVGDAGNVRARVLSATPAPAFAAPAGERVSTRRVVVSRPIETLQEVDVIEPVTKLHRVAVNTPTLFKTVRQDIARVPTTVPVLGKTIAHAAVPVGLYH